MTTPDPIPAAAPAPPRKRRCGRYLVLALAAPLLLLALYTWLALHWDYSNGYRSGMLQKFSKKGWICKTYEGELWQSVVANVAPNVWNFTVRDARDRPAARFAGRQDGAGALHRAPRRADLLFRRHPLLRGQRLGGGCAVAAAGPPEAGHLRRIAESPTPSRPIAGCCRVLAAPRGRTGAGRLPSGARSAAVPRQRRLILLVTAAVRLAAQPPSPSRPTAYPPNRPTAYPPNRLTAYSHHHIPHPLQQQVAVPDHLA